MTTETRTEACQACAARADALRYLQVSLTITLTTALENKSLNSGFLQGALVMAKRLAALYHIPWEEVIDGIQISSKLWMLVQAADENMARPRSGSDVLIM
jgi:hypothetical protein